MGKTVMCFALNKMPFWLFYNYSRDIILFLIVVFNLI